MRHPSYSTGWGRHLMETSPVHDGCTINSCRTLVQPQKLEFDLWTLVNGEAYPSPFQRVLWGLTVRRGGSVSASGSGPNTHNPGKRQAQPLQSTTGRPINHLQIYNNGRLSVSAPLTSAETHTKRGALVVATCGVNLWSRTPSRWRTFTTAKPSLSVGSSP